MIDRVQANAAPLNPRIDLARVSRMVAICAQQTAGADGLQIRTAAEPDLAGPCDVVPSAWSGPRRGTVLPTYSRVPSASRMKRPTSARAIDERTGPVPPRAI